MSLYAAVVTASHNEARAYLICLTANAIPPLPSVTRQCARCFDQHGTVTGVWVTHAMMARVDRGGATPICVDCAGVSMADQGKWVAMMAPEQVPELNALGLMGFADQFTTHLNRTHRWPGVPGA